MTKDVDVRCTIVGVFRRPNERHLSAVLFATAAISSSSVLTTTRVIRAESRAWRMDQAINGFPAISIIFLRGMLFDPPRAGISSKDLVRTVPAL